MKYAVVGLSVSLTFVMEGCGRASYPVNLFYPDAFTLADSAMSKDKGVALINLRPGENIVHFTKGTEKWIAVVDVKTGGDLYVSLSNAHMAKVMVAKEDR